MKRVYLIIAAVMLVCILNAQSLTPEVTSWLINTTGLTGYNNLPANVQMVQYSDSNVYVSCSCIPGYSIGPWTGDPSIPINKNFVFEISRYPVQNTGIADSVPLAHVGIWSNGVSIDNAWDAQTYNNDGVWQRNALVFEGVSFDNCLGHPQQGGEYHHHVSPKCLYDETDSTHHSPIIGYMFDGFPVYGAYAYTNTNGTGPIKRMTSSYRTRNITTRTTLADGSTASVAGPVVNSNYPIGDFLQDFEYVPGLGDLDERNGRFCITPDYPNGTYAYFVTIDSALNPVYPFVIGPIYYGKLKAGDTGMGSGHVTISESTTTYTPATSAIANTAPAIQYELTPNPTDGYAFLYMSEKSPNNVTAKLYDVNGRLLQTRQFIQPSIAYSFNLTEYPNGIYYLDLESNGQKAVEQIVKAQ